MTARKTDKPRPPAASVIARAYAALKVSASAKVAAQLASSEARATAMATEDAVYLADENYRDALDALDDLLTWRAPGTGQVGVRRHLERY